MKVVRLEQTNEEQFISFLSENIILHFYTLYGVRHFRDKVQIWVALNCKKISGYLAYGAGMARTHGATKSITRLLDYIDSDELVFVIEPTHLAAVKKVFEPVGPTDPSSSGKITTYLIMKANAETLKPRVTHRVKKLEVEDLGSISSDLGDGYREQIESAIRVGIAFGAYEGGKIISVAFASEVIEDLAMIRGVYTLPSFRGRGFATSVCSALAKELARTNKNPIVWVDEQNPSARKVYEKIGFKDMGHVLLGFKAKRLVRLLD